MGKEEKEGREERNEEEHRDRQTDRQQHIYKHTYRVILGVVDDLEEDRDETDRECRWAVAIVDAIRVGRRDDDTWRDDDGLAEERISTVK